MKMTGQPKIISSVLGGLPGFFTSLHGRGQAVSGSYTHAPPKSLPATPTRTRLGATAAILSHRAGNRDVIVPHKDVVSQTYPELDGVVYRDFSELPASLHPAETKLLHQIHYEYDCINIKRSGLEAIFAFLDALNARLTRACHDLGEYYPDYQISLYDSDEINASVLKHKPPGGKSYRGHVYMSTGMILKMIHTLTGGSAVLQPEDLNLLMTGIIGIMAHEFAHPKQDELIKWDWREGSDQALLRHMQCDEMTTDLMAQSLLKSAGLPAESVRVGLMLILGQKPHFQASGGSVFQAVVSSHPQDSLRDNVNRASLLHLRLAEGHYGITPIEVDQTRLLSEINHLTSRDSLTYRIHSIKKQAHLEGISPVACLMKDSVLKLQLAQDRKRGKEGNIDGYDAVLDTLRILDVFLDDASQVLTGEDKLAICQFFGLFFNGATNMYLAGESVHPMVFRAQKFELPQMQLFTQPFFMDWIEAQFQGDFWPVMRREWGGSFEYLPMLFPQTIVLRYYATALEKLESCPDEDKTDCLTGILKGLFFMGGPGELLEKVLHGLTLRIGDSENPGHVAQTIYMATLYQDGSENPVMRSYILETFRNCVGSHAPVMQDLQTILLAILQHPESLSGDDKSGLTWDLIGKYGTTFIWDFLLWGTSDMALGLPFKQKQPKAKKSDALCRLLGQIFTSPEWKNHIKKAFHWAGHPEHEVSSSDQFVFGMIDFFKNPKSGFTASQKLFLVKQIVGVLPTDADDQSFTGQIKFLAEIVAQNTDMDLVKQLTLYMDDLVRERTQNDLFHFFQTHAPGKPGNITRLFFVNHNDSLCTVLHVLLENNRMDHARYLQLMDKLILYSNDGWITLRLGNLQKQNCLKIWKHSKHPMPDPNAFLRMIKECFHLHPPGLDSKVTSDRQESRQHLNVGLKTDPDYFKFLSRIKEGLKADLLKLLKVKSTDQITSKNFAKLYRDGDSGLKEFLSSIFDPDGTPFATKYHEMANHHWLDELAPEILPHLPLDDLDVSEITEFWRLITARRANRHTDRIFENHVWHTLQNQQEVERLKNYEEILTYGRVRSEKIRVELLRKTFAKRVHELEKRKSGLDDREVSLLVDDIMALVPNTSRFRDKYLDELSWMLELSEFQLGRFIEPHTSFNFKALSPLHVNALSGLSLIVEGLNRSEKVKLIKYFQSGNGSLMDVSPKIRELLEKTRSKSQIKHFDLISTLESFVRDAGEGERLVLVETVVGSPGTGLWYQDTATREEIFELAGLPQGSLKRQLFDQYLPAVPEHEHSMSLSYLIANKMDHEDSELLRVMEAFDAPGIKFAQISAVLGIFGPERSKELESAKNRASPPTRVHVYKWLRDAMSTDEYAKIRRVRRLLGSGSMKAVVLVEYDNGTRHAVYLKRPFLEEKIDSTMDIAKTWASEMKKDPELAAKHDMEYYLEALGEQLADEIRFSRELKHSQDMAILYARTFAHHGWKFEPVLPNTDRPQTEHVMHFMAVENAVPFEELSTEDRRVAGELIVDTELKLLLGRGHFDADRHMGNYLFDPVNKRIYPIDMGQVYRLEKKRFGNGDAHHIAQILRGIKHLHTPTGAQILKDTFIRLSNHDEPFTHEEEQALQRDILKILIADHDDKTTLFHLLATLNRYHLHLPLRYTMGVIKGLMLVLNEKYAKAVDRKFIGDRLKKFVTTQTLKGHWWPGRG